jgi:putative flippase GtrA
MWFSSRQNKVKRPTATRIRFLAVALLATLIDVAMCVSLCVVVSRKVAYIAAFLVSLVLRFGFDRHFTFRNPDAAVGWQFLRYCLSCGLTLLIGVTLFTALAGYGLTAVQAKLASIPPVTVLGYACFRYFVFRGG